MPTNNVAYDGSRRIVFDVAIDRAGDGRKILSEREARAERRLDVRHQQRGADALTGDVADEQCDLAVRHLKVIEEIAADFTRRHRDALDFGQTETKRPVRQHLGLDLTPELELALDALLLHRRALMLLDVFRHLVERDGEPAHLVVALIGTRVL